MSAGHGSAPPVAPEPPVPKPPVPAVAPVPEPPPPLAPLPVLIVVPPGVPPPELLQPTSPRPSNAMAAPIAQAAIRARHCTDLAMPIVDSIPGCMTTL
jgi:hypothetical protein